MCLSGCSIHRNTEAVADTATRDNFHSHHIEGHRQWRTNENIEQSCCWSAIARQYCPFTSSGGLLPNTKTSPQWSGLMCAAARNRENREESIRQIAKSPTQFSHSVCVAVTGCGLAINRIVMFQCTLSAYRMYPRLMPPSGRHSHQT